MSLLVSCSAPPQTPTEAKPPAQACSLLYLRHQLLGGEQEALDGVCSRDVPAAQQAQNRLAEQQEADTVRAVPEARIMHGAWDGDEDQNHDMEHHAISLAGGPEERRCLHEQNRTVVEVSQAQLPRLHFSVPYLVPLEGAPNPACLAHPKSTFRPLESC